MTRSRGGRGPARLRKLRAAAAGLVGLASPSGVALSAAAPAHADTTWNYAQLNIRGYAGGNNGDPTIATSVKSFVRARYNAGRAPMAVSLQEVCHDPNGLSQLNSLASGANNLPSMGYTTKFYRPTAINPTRSNCTHYGIAVSMLWDSQAMPVVRTSLLPRANVGDERRGVICATTRFGGKWHNGCSTHLHNDSSALTHQAGPVTDFIADFNRDYPHFGKYWGGDLNTDPIPLYTASGSTPWRAGYEEADPNVLHPSDALKTWSIGNPRRKLDYLFAARSLWDDSSIQRYSYALQDHFWMFGRFTRH